MELTRQRKAHRLIALRPLRLIHDLIDEILHLLGLGECRLYPFMQDKTPQKRLQKRSALISSSTEYSSSFPMIHKNV